jgi:hypothetical protein
MPDDLTALAADAYIFGFPLVFNLSQVLRFTEHGMGSMAPASFNAFSHATQLAGPDDTFVSINNDTVYSMAQLDLSAGPLRIELPATDDRYYVMQFVDAWTNNFAYLGRRATGTEAGSYWIVPPGHRGELPAADGVIHAPTTVATIVGRWAVDGDDDLPVVRALQQQLTLTPLDPAAIGAGIPAVDATVPEELSIFAQTRAWEHAFPPAPAEQEYAQRFAALDDAGDDVLREGAKQGKAKLEAAITHGSGPVQNGWSLTYHVFDYNNDYFEIGALDDPQWRIADLDAARLIRALAARAGLWGNHGYEAAYAMVYTDGDGETLNGGGRYTVRFEKLPPVDAFWSITMYDTPEFFLVANPIGRYSVGDRTPGLKYEGDGSLTIVMQRDDPGGDETSNWLPTPPGDFRPILRMYQPRDAVFDGAYELPPVVRDAR